MSKTVFVFGSNERGAHGAGAARTAYEKHGARMKFSYGHWGDSFAIPTKDQQLETLPLDRIEQYVEGFLAYAAGHPELTFQVTRIGCGLAGLHDQTMAMMFVLSTPNCRFDEKWAVYLGEKNHHGKRSYWGTF